MNETITIVIFVRFNILKRTVLLSFCYASSAFCYRPTFQVSWYWLRSFGLSTQIMLTCYRAAIENVHMFTHNTVRIYHNEGTVQIEQSYKNCFQNNQQRPPQSWIIISAARVRKSHSHISWFVPTCPWPIWSPSPVQIHQNQDQHV